MGVDNRGLFCLVDGCESEEEEDDLGMIMEEEEDDEDEGEDEDEDSTSCFNGSSRSGSSLDSGDDASNSYSSPSSSLSSSQPNGALYDLSELVSNLPIKRGLSKFYQGKSQSFTSLARVTSLEDLAKKSNTYKARKVKACKTQRSPYYSTSPKSAISKKSSSFSCLRGKTMTTCFIANS